MPARLRVGSSAAKSTDLPLRSFPWSQRTSALRSKVLCHDLWLAGESSLAQFKLMCFKFSTVTGRAQVNQRSSFKFVQVSESHGLCSIRFNLKPHFKRDLNLSLFETWTNCRAAAGTVISRAGSIIPLRSSSVVSWSFCSVF